MESLDAFMSWPMGGVAGVFLVLGAAVFVFRRFVANRLEWRRADARDQVLRRRVSAKAARSVNALASVDEESLTESGFRRVVEMMDALVNGGNFDEAEKWALNAICNHPNRPEVPVKLAEIYFHTGRKSAFFAVVRNIASHRLEVPPLLGQKLARMSAELAPGEAVMAGLWKAPQRAD